jgi:hypothetical protein
MAPLFVSPKNAAVRSHSEIRQPAQIKALAPAGRLAAVIGSPKNSLECILIT